MTIDFGSAAFKSRFKMDEIIDFPSNEESSTVQNPIYEFYPAKTCQVVVTCSKGSTSGMISHLKTKHRVDLMDLKIKKNEAKEKQKKSWF